MAIGESETQEVETGPSSMSDEALLERIRALDRQQREYQKTAEERFERIFDFMEAREAFFQNTWKNNG